MRACLRIFLSLVVVAFMLVPGDTAHAGGLYLFDRGARALGRGGAFVAAPDDPSALWYNPAGLADAKRQILVDAVLPLLFADYARLSPDGSYSATVEANPTPLPIPTLAMSHDLGLRDFTFGIGLFAPNVVLLNWQRSVNDGRDPSPARYSLIGLKGSVLGHLALGVSYHGLKALSLGADVQLVGGAFKAETALSACDAAICSFPEQRDFDAYATVRAAPAFGVTGVLGATLNLGMVRLGTSVMLPYTLRGRGKLSLALPTNPLFEDASVSGDEAHLSMKFPTIVRAGVELRPIPSLRLEAAFVWEQWSRQKSIDIEVDGVRIEQVIGIGDYDVSDVSLRRDMRDTYSIRGGAEWFLSRHEQLAVRAGVGYETGAFASKTLTPLTIDTDKIVLSGGMSVGLATWLTFDATVAYAFMEDVTVTDSVVRQTQAIRPTLAQFPTVIGNGRYAQDALFLGAGLRMRL